MKTNIKREPAGFQPVTVEITLETPEELEYLYQFFNRASIDDRGITSVERSRIVEVIWKLYRVIKPSRDSMY